MNSPAIIPQALRKNAKLETILKAVLAFYRITEADIMSRARTEPLSTQRHVAMYLCRELTKAPFSTISDFFGRADHGTTLHAHRSIEERMAIESKLAFEIVAIRAQCRHLLQQEEVA